MAATIQLTIDCADPARLAEFWAAALGYEVQAPPQGFDSWEAFLEATGIPRERWNDTSAVVDPAGAGPRVFFQRVPEPKTLKNRLHIDIRSAGDATGDERMARLEQRADELVAIGAERLRRFEPDPSRNEFGFIVMRDPEGNEFCLD